MTNNKKITAGIAVVFVLAVLSFLFLFIKKRIAPESAAGKEPFALPDSAKLYGPEEMQITLWAESPMFFNPTNMDIDIRGRVWITEAVNYRDFNNKPETRLNHPKGERIVILEDTDRDGKADKSIVFVEEKELISPLGIAVTGNRVFVSAAPNLYVYTDENNDDKPDKKEVFLTGFGGLDHDHSLHSGVVSPDGQFFFNVGNAGPHLVTDRSGWTLRSGSVYTGGTPYNTQNQGNQVSDDGRVWVGGMALKVGLDGKGLKVLGHNFRNSYEVAIDSYGNMWQNDNDDQVIACRTSFLMENGNAGYFSADGTRYWQADRRPGQDMFTASWHQEDPGVMPAGDNTGAGSPTGVHVYEGDAFGPQYRGMLLSAEAGRNVIFSYFPKPSGAGFELQRNDLISSQGRESSEKYDWYETGEDKTRWFRPADICASTDGSIFIADWYDPIVGGHAMHDKTGYGRIYRLTPKGKKLKQPKMDLSTVKGQVEALKSPAQNVRYSGFSALLAGGEKSIPAVKKLLKADNPYHRARAIWLLVRLGKAGAAEVEKLLDSPDENLRLTAFRALRGQGANLVDLCNRVIDDPNPAMGREIGIALRDVPFENCKDLISRLIQRYDGADPWFLEAIGTASDRKEEAVYELVRQMDMNENKRVNLRWRLHPASALPDLKSKAGDPKIPEKTRSKLITALAFIADPAAAQAMLDLSKSALEDVSSQAAYWVFFRKTNDWADLIDWTDKTSDLISPNMKTMLALREKLTGKNTPRDEKIGIAKRMAADPDGGNMLVGLKAEYRLGDDIAAEVSEEIFKNPDQKVRILASQFFPKNGATVKLDFVNRMKGNPGKGKEIYGAFCAICHRHGNTGNDFGPDLSQIHLKFDKLTLLDAIVNPSASVVFGFEGYSISTRSGENYFGFIQGDDGKTVTLKDAAGILHSIRVLDIKQKEKMANSLMPNPTSMGLKEQELADLAAYLLNLK